MRVGLGGEEVALTMAETMLLRKGRQWGNHDDNDGKEEVVEEDCGECKTGKFLCSQWPRMARVTTGKLPRL